MMRVYWDWRFLTMICIAVVLIGAINQQTKNVLKVKHILRKIETHPPQADNKTLSEKVTEIELNDYIGYRLAQEKSTPIHHLQVALLDNNHVLGNIRLDAKQLNLAILFGDTLNFDFNGIVHSQKGAARIDLKALKLNGQPITQQMLDLIIQAAARYNGTKAGSVGDWYPLPKGIKRLLVEKGSAILYY